MFGEVEVEFPKEEARSACEKTEKRLRIVNSRGKYEFALSGE